MLKDNTFESLYRNELQDLYDAERQIIEAMPDMIRAASSEDLKGAFEEHLAETRQQLARLERLFAEMSEQPGKELCDGMRALISEGRMHMNARPSSPVLDAALIAAEQKIEHYEMSGYGTARAMAAMLGHEEAARLLGLTLEEEKETDAVLTDIAETVIGGEEMEAEAEKEELAS